MRELDSLISPPGALARHVEAGIPGGDPDRYRALLQRLKRDLGVAGSREVFLASAPGRTELAGNHTDHNRGKVLAASVQLDTIAAIAPRMDQKVVLYSEGFAPVEIGLDEPAPRPEERESTAALVRGVAAALSERGWRTGGFDAALSSTVAPGSGLSSSASVEVLLGAIFSHGWNDAAIGPLEIASAGKVAENDYFGKPSGLMDQVACATGGVVLIDFADPDSPEVQHMSPRFTDWGLSLLVVDTGGSHADLTAEYAAIPAEMGSVAHLLGGETLRAIDEEELLARLPAVREKAGDRAVARALHFFRENDRVTLMAEALANGDAQTYLRLMSQSGYSSAVYLQNCSVPSVSREQAVIVALALTGKFMAETGLVPGRDAAFRVHGGGFAGTIQVLVPSTRVQSYRAFAKGAIGTVTELTVRAAGAVAW